MQNKSKEERTITIKVSQTEKNFLEYCREIKFAEGTIIIMDGVAKKFLNPIESVRFDLFESTEV